MVYIICFTNYYIYYEKDFIIFYCIIWYYFFIVLYRESALAAVIWLVIYLERLFFWCRLTGSLILQGERNDEDCCYRWGCRGC